MIYQYNRALSGIISLFLKNLTVLPNTTYRFSANVLGDSFTFYITKHGVCNGNKTYKTQKCNTWTEFSFEFTTTNDKEALSTLFREWGISLLRTADDPLQEAGNAYLDNVRLTTVDKPSVNLIQGGTFEEKGSTAYAKNWTPEILGLSGKTHGVAIVTDPLDPKNHCLLLPTALLSPETSANLPVTVTQFRRYRKIEADIFDYIPHMSDEYLLLFPKKGEIRSTINDLPYIAQSGSIIVVPPWSSLQNTYLHGDNTDYYYFRFTGSEGIALMKKIGLDQPCVLQASDINAFAELVVRMLHLSPRSSSYFYALSGLALLFISELELQTGGASPHSKYRFLIEKITEQMQERPETPISNDELARQCGISKSHFINLFKQHTGCSPKQYRLRELIQKACVLLDTTVLNIQEISFSLGIDDPLYFSRLFKSIQGVSPREYRKQHKTAPTP